MSWITFVIIRYSIRFVIRSNSLVFDQWLILKSILSDTISQMVFDRFRFAEGSFSSRWSYRNGVKHCHNIATNTFVVSHSNTPHLVIIITLHNRRTANISVDSCTTRWNPSEKCNRFTSEYLHWNRSHLRAQSFFVLAK